MSEWTEADGRGYRLLERHETIRDDDMLPIFRAGTPEHERPRPMRRIRLESPGWRELDSEEPIQAGDEWLCHKGWWRRRIDAPASEQGLTREEIQEALDERQRCVDCGQPCWCSEKDAGGRCVECQEAEERRNEDFQVYHGVLCGCGKHEIDPRGDVYSQHRAYLGGDTPFGEIEYFANIGHVPGVGISRPEIEVGFQLQDFDGDGL